MVQKVMTSDERLINTLRSAELKMRDRALRCIYEEHYNVISTFVLKNSGSESDAEDIFQDAIIVFYKQAQNHQFELSCSIRTYLYAICRNLWLKQLSKRNKSIQLIGEWDEIIAIDQPALIYDEEQREALAGLLGKMGEGCRKLLVLYFYERMRMKDIATAMDLANEGVVKNKKLRCMKKLQQFVKESPIFKAVFRNT